LFLTNFEKNAIFRHLSKRGILTNEWVINDDDELKYLLKTSASRAIMTDRPAHFKSIIKIDNSSFKS
jgi:hypothetical protein